MNQAFIPQTADELIEKMKENNFKGEFYKDDKEVVVWKNGFKLTIILNNMQDEAYVMLDGFANIGGHDHILMTEIWNYLQDFNIPENIIVKEKNFLGRKKKKLYWRERLEKDHEHSIFYRITYDIIAIAIILLVLYLIYAK